MELDIETLIKNARDRTHLLYDGVEVAHRSCGIAIAETYGHATAPYQALRKGGITGEGECGAIRGGTLLLGEVFGDPSPTGGVTDVLRAAIARYNVLWQEAVDRGVVTDSIVCNDLTGQFESFQSSERHAFCTDIASTVSECVARVILEFGGEVVIGDRPDV